MHLIKTCACMCVCPTISLKLLHIKSNQIKFISGDKAHSTQTQMTIKHTHTYTPTHTHRNM